MQYMKVGRKKYIVKRCKLHNRYRDTIMTLQPYNKEEHDAVLNEIVELTKKCIDKKTIIKQALGKLEWDAVLEIRKKLRQGAKPKARKGCFSIDVGSSYIPIQN